jgi:mono/diheme cytochrome c family protein
MVREPWAIADMVRKPWAIAVIGAVVVAIATALGIVLHVPDPGISAAVARRQPDVSHGEYIYRLADCAACHTKPGGETLAGGLPLVTPMGTIYTTNITPDRDTGIGDYSFIDFARAVRLGVRPDGTRLYPAMPYTSYTKMSDEDLQDLFGYLQKSIAPVKASAPATSLAWPFSMRWTLAFWNVVFLDSFHFTADQSKDAQWNRGAYVVEALEHCGECHTPRRVTQNLNNSQKFSGAALQGWKAYNISGSKQSGVGGWSDDLLAAYLSTGHADGHSSASGPMAEAIDNSLRYASTDDIHAIVAYLRTIPAIENAVAIAQNPPAATDAEPPAGLGEQVFAGNCANCHDWNGKGVQSPYASLLGSRTVNDPEATNLIAILLSGSSAPLPIQNAFMPPFAHGHSDDELAAVANFVNSYFGNGTSRVTAADIDKARKSWRQIRRR